MYYLTTIVYDVKKLQQEINRKAEKDAGTSICIGLSEDEYRGLFVTKKSDCNNKETITSNKQMTTPVCNKHPTTCASNNNETAFTSSDK